MSKTKLKQEVKEEIEKFFKDIIDKTPKEIRKIKKLAMSYNIPLKEKRKLFCKKCLNAYSGKERVRVKKGRKIIWCEVCGNVNRLRMK